MLIHVEVGALLLERAYAKINLTLDVLGRRPDGYHEVDMVLQSVDLSDLVWLDRRLDADVVMESNAAHIPTDDRNLAVQAAKLFLKHTGISSGVSIHLEKNIPVAAGLAGGSSDAAAVLRGLNRLFEVGLSSDELASMAAEIGSDVPFCVYGGTAIARGRGELLTRFLHQCQSYVLMIHPKMFVSTGDIYQALKPSDYDQQACSPQMVEALLAQDVDRISELVWNRLEQVTFHLYPELVALATKVESVTRAKVHMSGSGPTLFCLAPTLKHANRMNNALRGIMRDIRLTHFITTIPSVGSV
jgi:4-diphosphocytidyl-2-C-methyl-D-erythritol kinase